MWQQLLIAVAVAGALAYVVWSLMSARARLRLLDVMSRQGVATGWVAKRRARLAAAGGCGNCSVASAHPAKRAASPR